MKECLREAVKDRDCNRELTNTLMEDIEEMINERINDSSRRLFQTDREFVGVHSDSCSSMLLF